MKPSKSLSYLTSSLTSLTPAARARTLSVRFVSRHATTSTERRTVGAPTAVDGGIRRRGLSGVSLGNGPRLGRAAKDTSGSSSVSEERGTKGETGAPKAPGRGFHSQASYGLVGDPGAGTTGPLGDLASSSVDFLPLANKSSLPPPPHSNSATSSTSYVPSSTSTPTQSVPPPEGAVLLTRTGPTFSAPSLPSYFGGTSLSTVRRSNLVLRNGAYGIPKASLGFEGKGKGKMLNGVPERETREGDCPHSVGIGEDAVRSPSFLVHYTDSVSVLLAIGRVGRCGRSGRLVGPCRGKPGALVEKTHAAYVVRIGWERELMRWIDCSAELARYDNIEDEMFLQYYEVDPIVVLQRAFEVSIAECKEEVRLPSPSSGTQRLCDTGSDRELDGVARGAEERRAACGQHGRLLLLVSRPLLVWLC